MLNEYTSPSVGQLADRWWMPVVRGAAAILFGVLTFAMPQVSLLSLVLLWGAYAVIDGVFNVTAAVRGARAGRHWGWLLFEGIVSIGAGVVAFAWPGITALALLVVIAAWGVLTGIAAIAAAVRLRKVIRGEWLLGLSGVLSIAFGVLLVAVPSAGALALLWMIGAYAVVAGLLLIGLGVRLRSWRHGSGRAIPSGGMPMQV